MKTKKILSILIMFALLLSAGSSAYAMVQGEIDESIPPVGVDAALARAWQVVEADAGKTLVEIAEENNAIVYHYNQYGEAVPPEPVLKVTAEMSWDDVLNLLLEKYDVNRENIAVTYFNTVTGESHSLNPDRYFISASLFKIPLNMIYADRVSAGEMSMDTDIFGAPYSWYQWRSITHSDNGAAMTLEQYLGGYTEMRDRQVPYIGKDPKDDLGEYVNHINNWYTAGMFDYALRMLYAEPERFPGVLECMMIAHPYEYFKMWERRVPIAQKYGFVEETDEYGQHLYLNDCGIIYASQPCIVVMLTKDVNKAYDVIGEFSTLMLDYTEYRAAEYEQIEQQAQEQAKAELEARNLSDWYQAPPATAKAPVENESGKESHMSVFSTVLCLAILSLMLFAAVFIFRRNKGGRIRGLWAIPAVILAGAAMILCVYAVNVGTLVAKPEGNPQDTVHLFFDSIMAKDYETAYGCLSNYSSLGLEQEPDSEEGKLVYAAVKNSWAYSLKGDCRQDKLHASQDITMRYLDLKGIEEDAAARVEGLLNEIVQSRPISEVFDENNGYREEITDEVYLRAISAVLENQSQYYRTKDLTVSMDYKDGRWLISADRELLSALTGGAA